VPSAEALYPARSCAREQPIAAEQRSAAAIAIAICSIRSCCGISREHARIAIQENPGDGTWVAFPADMQPSFPSEQTPGLEGPDYVALVIEWNDEEDDSTARITASESAYSRGRIRTIAAVVGALGALLLAAWGIRRLRSA
jgi:hypothetical protein